ncbi:MAG: hypothetical protein ACYCSS_00545 [Sulfuriferula sp.]
MISQSAVGEQAKQIIVALLKAQLSMNELMAVLGLKSKPGSPKRTVNELLAGEFVE